MSQKHRVAPAGPRAEDGAPDPDREVARLRWRCRRGMKELDVVLLRYLEGRWPVSGAGERRAFEALLGLPDPDVMDLLAGRRDPGDPELAAVVERILQPPGA